MNKCGTEMMSMMIFFAVLVVEFVTARYRR